MKRQSFGCVLIFALSTLWYCKQAIFSGDLLFALGGDQFHSYHSALVYYHEWIRKGILPLWNMLSLAGQPFGLHSVSLFDNYRLFGTFINADLAYNVTIILGLFLNGVVFFYFLRRKGASHYGALIGGVIWMISMSSSPESGFFYFPLCFYVMDKFWGKFNRQNYLLLVCVIVFFLFNSNPQSIIYVSILLFCYGLYVSPARRSKKILWTVSPFVFAGGLVMFHFIRLIELAKNSTRSLWVETQTLSPVQYVLSIFPDLFKSVERPDLNFMLVRVQQSVFSKLPFSSHVDDFLSPPYLGVFAIVALIIGVFNFKRNRGKIQNFALVSVAMVLGYLTFHPILYSLVIRHIPFLGGMTNIMRVFDVYKFAIAILSAFAVDYLLFESGAKAVIKKVGIVLSAITGVVVVGMIAVRVILIQFKDVLAAKMASQFRIDSTESIYIENAQNFKSERIQEFFTYFDHITSTQSMHVWVPVGLMVILFLLLWTFRKGYLSRNVFQVLFLAFILFDLCHIMGFTMPSSPKEQVYQYQAMADFLKKDKDLFRVCVIEDKTRSFNRMFLRPETNMTYGISTPDGYEQLYQKKYVEFYTRLTKRKKMADRIMNPTHEIAFDLANVINCKYFLTSDQSHYLDDKSFLNLVYEGLATMHQQGL